MRNFTKSLLALALMFVCVGGAKAVNHYLVYNNGVASANGWDKQAVLTLNANLVAGTEYILKAKIKVSASTEEAVQAVPIFSTSENKDTWGNSADVQYLAGYNPTTEFKEYVWYFTAAYTHDKIQFFMGKIGGDVYFDDVTLRENGGSTEFVDNGNMSDANISNWGKNWGGPSFTRWDYEENITVGVDRFMTFSNIKNLSVDGIVSAYGAKYSAGKVVLTPITAIPANKAVIIEADAGPYALPAINSAASIDDVNDLQGKSKSRTDQAYFMINPEDLKYTYIEHLSAVTINTEIKKLHVKSPEFVKIENEKNELMLELDRLKFDIDSLKNMIGK